MERAVARRWEFHALALTSIAGGSFEYIALKGGGMGIMRVTNSENYFGLNYIATGEHTDGQYFQCSTSIPAGDAGPPTHMHENESEGFYVISGLLTLVAGGKEHKLSAGDFFIVMPKVTHTWRNESSKTVELLITFSPSGIENMFRELDEPNADFISIGAKYGMTIAE